MPSPKRLAAAGLVRMRREQVGRRNRTIYEITPAGREALRRQLATLPAPPQLEFEALQRAGLRRPGQQAGPAGRP